MDAERWHRLERLYNQALELKDERRAAFVEQACGGDDSLRLELLRLLNESEPSEDMFEMPALDVAAKALARSAARNQGGPSLPAVIGLLQPGTLLGPYKVLAMLGSGGMGQVYNAIDTRLNRNVALKVLPPELAQDSDRMKRFVRESRALASLNHPNIVAAYDVGEDFIVTELVKGGTLRGCSFPLRKTLEIISQAADGLAAAHAARIIHRDIKPENLLLTPEGRVKIVDFGVALQVHGSGTTETVVTQPGMIVGTAAYMSPEQVQGLRVDSRSDIFSLGVVLYELLSGHRCFEHRTLNRTLYAIVHEPAAKLPDSVAVPVCRVVSRCLEKDPALRYQTAEELALDLRTLAAVAAANEVPQSSPEPIRETREPVQIPRGKRKWLLIGCASVITLETVLLLFLTTSRQTAKAPLMKFVLSVSGAADIDQGVTPTFSADGTMMVFPSVRADGRQQLMLQRLDQTTAAPLAGTTEGFGPFFSPTGDEIGFFTTDGHLKKTSIRGGSVATLCAAPGPFGASWDERGDVILAPGPASGLVWTPSGALQPEAITYVKNSMNEIPYGLVPRHLPATTSDVTHRWPQALPGGRAVLFTAKEDASSFDGASIKALSLPDMKVKLIYKGGYFARYVPSGYLLFVQKGKLLAARFDPGRLELKETPREVIGDLAPDAGTGDGRFDFSVTGLFAYQSGVTQRPQRQLVWLDESGKKEPLTTSRGSYFNPRISPDGTRVVLQAGSASGGDLMMLDSRTGDLRPLTSDGQQQRYAHPVWSPDGKHVFFSYMTGGQSAIGWLRAVGGLGVGAARPVLRAGHSLIPGSFSPDGGSLAYSELADGGDYDVSILPMDTSDADHPEGGKPEVLIKSKADESTPMFSPDGRWLAYTSTESGVSEVYVCRYPACAGKSLISSGGGRSPAWSRKQNVIFYENDEGRMMAVSYRADGEMLKAETPGIWSGENAAGNGHVHTPGNFDLEPDGRRFAVFTSTDAHGVVNAPRVILFVNFFDEIVRRMQP